MDEMTSPSETPMHVVGKCLVVPVQVELRDEQASHIQRDILRTVDRTAALGVVIDVSGVNVIDSFLAQTLDDTLRMVSLLGAVAVLVGLKPEVVASLVDLENDLRGVRTARTLQQGLDLVESILAPEMGAEIAEGPEEAPSETESTTEDEFQQTG